MRTSSVRGQVAISAIVALGLIAGGTVFTALLGSLLTLRRIVRIDPASAIG